MTTLKEYLDAPGESVNAMSKRIGISQSYLSEIKTGKKSPSLRVAHLIVQDTKGRVSYDELWEGSRAG